MSGLNKAIYHPLPELNIIYHEHTHPMVFNQYLRPLLLGPKRLASLLELHKKASTSWADKKTIRNATETRTDKLKNQNILSAGIPAHLPLNFGFSQSIIPFNFSASVIYH